MRIKREINFDASLFAKTNVENRLCENHRANFDRYRRLILFTLIGLIDEKN